MNQILSVGRQYLVWLIVPICFLAAGCGREDVRVYEIPKEVAQPAAQNPHAAMSSPHGAGSRAALPHIHFERPEGWTEQPAAQMRVASFKVEGTDGMDADVSVIPLPGVTGQDVQIVNLWREPLQLEPWDQDDLEGAGSDVTVGGEKARLFSFVSEAPLIQQKEKAQIVVAMMEREGTSWFFKMTGPATLVSNQRDEFESFLKSVEFATDSHGPPAMGGMEAGVRTPTMGAAAGPELPDWEVPGNWKAAPPPSMILAKFTVGDAANGATDITVSSFPGDVGGIELNVNRWRGQIGLQGVSGDEMQKLLSPLQLSEGSATLVDMAGTSMDNGERARMLAAIVPREGETWFYKMLGPESVVAAEKAAFIQFVQSVKYPDAH